jgi:predicted O-methyltransferase YrrM
MAGLIAVLLCLLFAGPLRPQTADEIEKRIANLPPPQRAYERFRAWISQLPPDQQRDPKIEDRYRQFLTGRGFTESEAGAQIKLVNEQGKLLEVERWNRILTAERPAFNTNPNAFLMEMAKTLKPGQALDVGMGQGRNSIWLAQQGWEVTGFDPAERAVATAQANAGKLGVKLHTEIKTSEDFDFGESRWDLILLSYVDARSAKAKVQNALKPGGVVVVEGFHRDAAKGRSIGGAVVFDTGELTQIFPKLRTVRYEEPVAAADFGGQEKLRVVRYCGMRPD